MPQNQLRLTKKPKQSGFARLGRPPGKGSDGKVTHARWLAATQALCLQIKVASGLTNAELEERLNLGKKDDSGHYSGRYFSRYLGGKNPSALKPDRLGQVAETARKEGWLHPAGIAASLRSTAFDDWIPEDGVLVTENLAAMRQDMGLLLAAQKDAVAALERLRGAMVEARLGEFIHVLCDGAASENVVFEGLGLDLATVLEQLTAAFVVPSGFSRLGELMPETGGTNPAQREEK